MSPITETKLHVEADVKRVFDALRLSTEDERSAARALGSLGADLRAKYVLVTRLSNGSAPAPRVED